MHIEQIATRFDDRPDPQPGDTPIAHPYRARWWLPVIGPTASCALTHLSTDTANSAWQLTAASELAAALGLGRACSTNSALIKSLMRLTQFGFGHFDIEPGHPGCDPCLTLYRTASLVPQRFTRRWPEALQQAHAIDLAELHRQTA